MAGLKIAAAALLGLATVAAAQGEAGDASEPDAIDEVALLADRHQRMTVPVTIDGQGPYRFFIDTGAQATVVTRKVTDQLNIEPSGSAMLVAMGSRKMVETVELDELEFANRSFSGLVTPLLEGRNIGADGILGLDSLQDLRVLINFSEDKIQVADAKTLGGNYGYEIIVRARRKLGQMIITDARVNGIRTAVIIDTGAQNSMGNRRLLRRLRARERETMVSTDVHGIEIESQLVIARQLAIGDMELSQVPIGFADSPAFDALGYKDRPALILGMANLRMFERVAIDFATQKVLFDLPKSSTMRGLIRGDFMASRTKS